MYSVDRKLATEVPLAREYIWKGPRRVSCSFHGVQIAFFIQKVRQKICFDLIKYQLDMNVRGQQHSWKLTNWVSCHSVSILLSVMTWNLKWLLNSLCTVFGSVDPKAVITRQEVCLSTILDVFQISGCHNSFCYRDWIVSAREPDNRSSPFTLRYCGFSMLRRGLHKL